MARLGEDLGQFESVSEEKIDRRSSDCASKRLSIHGGRDPGSNGCIDLTSGMDGFADFYRNTGQSAELNVSYPEYDPDKQGDGKAASETGGRWEPDGASSRRSFLLRDALRFWE